MLVIWSQYAHSQVCSVIFPYLVSYHNFLIQESFLESWILVFVHLFCLVFFFRNSYHPYVWSFILFSIFATFYRILYTAFFLFYFLEKFSPFFYLPLFLGINRFFCSCILFSLHLCNTVFFISNSFLSSITPLRSFSNSALCGYFLACVNFLMSFSLF